MRWDDERYVRVYTRDTADWLALGWEAQSLLVLAFRKMDRAGIIELGRAGTRGLAAVVGMPFDVVERTLPILLADGCLTLSGSTLVAPNFIEAQEAIQTDAQRKRESRARARERVQVTKRDQRPDIGHAPEKRGTRSASEPQAIETAQVTKRDATVTKPDGLVTKSDRCPDIGHAVTKSVTPNCAVPNRAVEEKPCVEPLAASTRASTPEASPVVALLPVVGKGPGEWPVTAAKVAEWSEAYPGVDVMREVRALVQWARDNPTKRKTYRGAAAFFSRNLARKQDQKPNGRTNGRPLESGEFTDEQWKRARDEAEAYAEGRLSYGDFSEADRERASGSRPPSPPIPDVPEDGMSPTAALRKLLGDRWKAGALQDPTPVEHRPELGGAKAQGSVPEPRNDAQRDGDDGPRPV